VEQLVEIKPGDNKLDLTLKYDKKSAKPAAAPGAAKP
jgi:hypothetical protein